MPLTKDSSGQPLLMPMVPGSSRRLKSFFWNWKPLTQPFRPTAPASSALWSHTHTFIYSFFDQFFRCMVRGRGCWRLSQLHVSKSKVHELDGHQLIAGPYLNIWRFSTLFTVTSAVLWRCTGTYSTTSTRKRDLNHPWTQRLWIPKKVVCN